MQVLVRDNNVDQALRALKQQMQREGVFREMKLRRNYEKPSERRAREKAEAVYTELAANGSTGDGLVVVGADTTVTLDKQILGKPEDERGAARMLRLLSGRSHRSSCLNTGVLKSDAEWPSAHRSRVVTAVPV